MDLAGLKIELKKVCCKKYSAQDATKIIFVHPILCDKFHICNLLVPQDGAGAKSRAVKLHMTRKNAEFIGFFQLLGKQTLSDPTTHHYHPKRYFFFLGRSCRLHIVKKEMSPISSKLHRFKSKNTFFGAFVGKHTHFTVLRVQFQICTLLFLSERLFKLLYRLWSLKFVFLPSREQLRAPSVTFAIGKPCLKNLSVEP